jgi:hypothetical protein|tara:strand:+ start:613 stop:816 length:204 start_codon:yes stop_codon:yes gene_type:complete
MLKLTEAILEEIKKARRDLSERTINPGFDTNEQYIKTVGIVYGLDKARDIIKDIQERYMKGDILEDE